MWKLTNSVAQAARYAKVSYKVAKRWIDRYGATGSVNNSTKSGRKCIMNKEAMEKAYMLLVRQKIGPSQLVAKELYKQNLVKKLVYKSTIIKAVRTVAKQYGTKVRALRGKPRKMLNQQTKEKRQKFCKANLKRSWKYVMFTDRKRFFFSYPGAKVPRVTWVESGEERSVLMASHPLCVNVYAGLTYFGPTKLHCVSGTSKKKSSYINKKGGSARNITQNEYIDVLENTLLPEGDRLFKVHNRAEWVLQQDNDPTHVIASAVIKDYNNIEGSAISLLNNWPPSSPDLSPIENLWGIVQAKLDAKGCKTFDEFKKALEIEWNSLEKSLCRDLVSSMKGRLEQCLLNRGDKINY